MEGFIVIDYDVVVIGGGPAGMAAAISARQEGIERIVVLEKDDDLGGILNQCIHIGFGLYNFREELTGPEYAERFSKKLIDMNIEYKLNTTVIDITKDKIITAVNPEEGVVEIRAKSIILSMGCRERPRGDLNIPGSKCAGIYTAGTAQRFVNIEGVMPGKEIVILGSSDIGLLMARRVTLEGAKVNAVVDMMPYSIGLKRYEMQCLKDFNIPLMLNHTLVEIKGKDRLEGIIISKVDENRRPIKGTEEHISCDTLILSVSLMPDNALSLRAGVDISNITGGAIVNESMETSIEGIFACGNILHVHDLIDDVTNESYEAGRKAAKFVKGEYKRAEKNINIACGDGIRYVVPDTVNPNNLEEDLEISFKVDGLYKNAHISLLLDNREEICLSKRILAPGDMEKLKVSKTLLENNKEATKITLKVVN